MASALVTGATGYTGRHLVRGLLGQGWRVHVVVRPSSDPRDLHELDPAPDVVVHDGSTDSMLSLVRHVRPDIIFHLAARTVRHDQPQEIEPLIASNVLFGTQLLEAARQEAVRGFVNVGSYWQYRTGMEYDPVNLYAATKQAFGEIFRYFTTGLEVPGVTLVLFDVYGPSDPRDKLIPSLCDAARSGRRVALSAGDQTVDLIYIDDVVAAFLRIADSLLQAPQLVAGGRFAVSSGNRMTLREAVDILAGLLPDPLHVDWGARSHHPRRVTQLWTGDPVPEWRPQVGLEEGLRRVIAATGE